MTSKKEYYGAETKTSKLQPVALNDSRTQKQDKDLLDKEAYKPKNSTNLIS